MIIISIIGTIIGAIAGVFAFIFAFIASFKDDPHPFRSFTKAMSDEEISAANQEYMRNRANQKSLKKAKKRAKKQRKTLRRTMYAHAALSEINKLMK